MINSHPQLTFQRMESPCLKSSFRCSVAIVRLQGTQASCHLKNQALGANNLIGRKLSCELHDTYSDSLCPS